MPEENGGDTGFLGVLAEEVKPFFNSQWEDFFTKLLEAVPNYADKIHEDLKEKVFSIDDKLWDYLIKIGTDAGILSEYQINLFNQFKEMPAVASYGSFIMVVIGIIMQVSLATGGAATQGIRNDINTKTRPTLADPGSLVRSCFIAPEKTKEARVILAKHGYSDEMIDYLFLAQYSLYDVNTCREL